MSDANEYLIQNKELNYISKGFLWSLWNLLPIAGSIIMVIKILNRIFKSTSSKVLMFIALIIPFVNIAAGIAFCVLVFKRIGGKFLIGILIFGILIMPFLFGISAGFLVPLYTDYVEKARVTEATSMMGAIITAEKVYKQRTLSYFSADSSITVAGDPNNFKTYGIDVTDAVYFSYVVTVTPAVPPAPESFTITASGTDKFDGPGLAGTSTITYDSSAPPDQRWSFIPPTGKIMSDLLPLAPGT